MVDVYILVKEIYDSWKRYATNLTKLWVFDRKQCIQISGREFIADMRTPFLCLKVFVLYKYVCNIAYMNSMWNSLCDMGYGEAHV